tara:strand:- start:13243 stop:13839 length:597 start_codon:yes stop_codon:yes gene_type:complete
MTSNNELPKRIVADRDHIMKAILLDLDTMDQDTFIKNLKENHTKYLNMDMVNKKQRKVKMFKLVSVTPWTLYSNEYINANVGDQKKTLSVCAELRKKAAPIWKNAEVDIDSYNEKAKVKNAERLLEWRKAYADKEKTAAELNADLKSVENIKTMKRKDLVHNCGCTPELRDKLTQACTIKELRTWLINQYEKANTSSD